MFVRRPHDGSSSIIQIGEGNQSVDVEILEVQNGEVVVRICAPNSTPVRAKESVNQEAMTREGEG